MDPSACGPMTRSRLSRRWWVALVAVAAMTMACGDDEDDSWLYLIASSGQTGWGETAALNTTAATDGTANDNSVSVATDRQGAWLAVWRSNSDLGGTIGVDGDILGARSTDGGRTWSAPAPLNSNAATDFGDDAQPVVRVDGAGTWLAVWASNDDLGGTIGTDYDILWARSTDGGQTWSTPAPLNGNAATDSGSDYDPQLETAGTTFFIAAWESSDDLGGTIGADWDILSARSADGGQTWTAPVGLNSDAATDSKSDNWVALATDGSGIWVAVWSGGSGLVIEYDVLVSRSTDGGQTWSTAAALNANPATDPGQDARPDVTTDAKGHWVAIWESNNNLGGTVRSDVDIHLARSVDGGQTWTAPAALNTNAGTDFGNDAESKIATDGAGNWIAVWASVENLGGTIGTDADILWARSTDAGLTWSAPAALNSSATSDSRQDEYPEVETDGAGSWVAAWQSLDSLGGTIGTDYDVLWARGRF